MISTFNPVVKVEDTGAFKYEWGTIESNAIFLEETLEKLFKAERFWLQKRYSKRNDPVAFAAADLKVKDIQKGITEVHNKADKIWKDIAAGKTLPV